MKMLRIHKLVLHSRNRARSTTRIHIHKLVLHSRMLARSTKMLHIRKQVLRIRKQARSSHSNRSKRCRSSCSSDRRT